MLLTSRYVKHLGTKTKKINSEGVNCAALSTPSKPVSSALLHYFTHCGIQTQHYLDVHIIHFAIHSQLNVDGVQNAPLSDCTV